MTTLVYDVYGLAIASGIALPFALADRPPDVEVVWRGPDGAPPPSAPGREFQSDAEGWRLRYLAPGGAWGELAYARAERRLTLSGSGSTENFVQPLMGPAAAVLLREAGCCVLHGAAVARDGRALALLGPSGAGKSTLAAALIAAGEALVTDDLVAIWPGAPTLAAGPDVISLGDEAARRFAHVGTPVRTRPSDAKTWVRPLLPAAGRTGLGAVIILAPFEDGLGGGAVTTLAPREATIALLRNLYGVAWIGAPSRADLAACARIAQEVPVRRLHRPRDLAALETTARSLLAAA
jgi:hypothetical protein